MLYADKIKGFSQVNVYIIYKFSDAQQVDQIVNELKEKDKSKILNFFKFEASGCNRMWHKKATEKMKKCNAVCYFCNLNESSAKAKNVKWELKLANKYRKTVFIFKLNSSELQNYKNDFTQSIFGVDYSEELLDVNKYKIYEKEEAFNILTGEAKWSIENDVINKKFDREKIGAAEYYKLLFEEYKVMVDTSEKLMERRQNISNLYTTLCSALVAAIGASFAFENWLVTAYIGIVAGLVFIFLSANWRACLKAYDKNNAGKFAVINAIEKILPADLFNCEYRYNTKNGIKSYSTREKILPIIFLIFGVFLLSMGAIVLILSINGVLN